VIAVVPSESNSSCFKSHPLFPALIYRSKDGQTFLVKDTERFATEIIPEFFKVSLSLLSCIRLTCIARLNNYLTIHPFLLYNSTTTLAPLSVSSISTASGKSSATLSASRTLRIAKSPSTGASSMTDSCVVDRISLPRSASRIITSLPTSKKSTHSDAKLRV
jgi:hypothetical protein